MDDFVIVLRRVKRDRGKLQARAPILKPTLFTIGYIGFAIQDFVSVLAVNGIDCLIDTRELPISRKKGFAKTALQQHLHSSGIEYRHLRNLGSPRVFRHKVRETNDYEQFFTEMRTHLETAAAVSEITKAIAIANENTACLMCCCPDWQLCHRRCVVESIVRETPFVISHIQR